MLYAIFGCEESQVCTMEFRAKGHQAFSCDLLPCSGGFPEYHFQMDILKVIAGGKLKTQAGTTVNIPFWNMGIFFPPCTYVTVSGNRCRMPL